MKIDFPTQLEKDYLDPFFEKLRAAETYPDKVTINFSTLGFSTPTSMLVVGVVLRNWVGHRKSLGLETWRSGLSNTNQAHSYLMHLGFFDFINIQAGKLVGEAKGSQTYLPITIIEKPNDTAKSGDLEAWYESIIGISRSLSGVLAGSHDDSKDLRIYSYSIREIIRNVFEHSGANQCFICGQRWGNGAAEFAVVDEGVGICSTLRMAYDIKDDEDALFKAITPGVSRTAGLTNEENTYDNSGFGLYVLSQVGSNFGWFMLGSGQAKVIGSERKITASASSFDGTYIGIRLNKTPSDVHGLLDDIISAGEAEAQLSGNERRASALSKSG